MSKFDTIEHFKIFERNLRTSQEDINKINERVKVITKIINQAYWEQDSETNHSLLVGSYGRGTAIHLSDIDLLVELPVNQKERFEKYSGNGQSALLQDVKNKLLNHYSNSNIKGDGQIVSIEFSDGIRFELLPAFKIIGTNKYEYPDANNGGSWKETHPKLEQTKLTECNENYYNTVKKFCRMLRAWNDTNNIGLHGIAIDSLIYNFFKTWKKPRSGYIFFDLLTREFFMYVIHFIENNYILQALDGSYKIDIDSSIKPKVYNSLKDCKEAIDSTYDPQKSEIYWRKIYGEKFPRFIHTEGLKNNQISISNRKNREPIGYAIDTEQFVDEIGWDIDIKEIIKIKAHLEVNGFRRESILRKIRIPIKPNSRIIFSVKDIPNITWYWKVRNVGLTANNQNAIRGQIIKRTNRISEPISFRGNHYVEVYGVSNNKVQVYGKINVPLEDFYE